jgi:hypothetical protein
VSSATVLLSAEDVPEVVAHRLVDAHEGDADWLDRLVDAIDRRRAGGELARILSVWGLSKAEAARVFGVSRQALGKWVSDGVPAERTEAVADLSAATDLLVRYLRRDRIPAVVRRGFDRAGGRSILEVAAEDPAAALAHVRAMFDFSRVQA